MEVEESVRRQWQRHLGAFCILLAFIQLYMLLVRIAPNTPIPVYINMFTTVLKTYTFILLRFACSLIIQLNPFTFKRFSTR